MNEEKNTLEKDDPMKALENRVLASQKEMADLDNLEEIKAMNARHVKLLYGKNNNILVEKDDTTDNVDLLTAEDEALVKSIQFKKSTKNTATTPQDLFRLEEQDEIRLEQKRQQSRMDMEYRQQQAAAQASSKVANTTRPILNIKRRRISENTNITEKEIIEADHKETKPSNPQSALASLLGGYSSDSS
jgi:Saf4/Yju2 protein